MRLKIVQAGEPVRREPARVITPSEIVCEEIQRLILDMRETMRDAPGVGLAAPQVGLSFQLAMIEDREDLLKALPADDLAERERRPVSFHYSEEKRIFYEGRLGLHGFSAVVLRAHAVRVEYLDERAKPQFVEASGWYARILQREIDHLHGKLYIDHMQSRTFTSLENFARFHKGKPIPGLSPTCRAL
jgi:peptide deformylase